MPMIAELIAEAYGKMTGPTEGVLLVETELGTECVPSSMVQSPLQLLDDFVIGENIFDVTESHKDWIVWNGVRWVRFSCVTTAREFADGVIG